MFYKTIIIGALLAALTACKGMDAEEASNGSPGHYRYELVEEIPFVDEGFRNCVLSMGVKKVEDLKTLDCSGKTEFYFLGGLEYLFALESFINRERGYQGHQLDVTALSALQVLDIRTASFRSTSFYNNRDLREVYLKGIEVDLSNNLKLEKLYLESATVRLPQTDTLKTLTLLGLRSGINLNGLSGLIEVTVSHDESLGQQGLYSDKAVILPSSGLLERLELIGLKTITDLSGQPKLQSLVLRDCETYDYDLFANNQLKFLKLENCGLIRSISLPEAVTDLEFHLSVNMDARLSQIIGIEAVTHLSTSVSKSYLDLSRFDYLTHLTLTESELGLEQVILDDPTNIVGLTLKQGDYSKLELQSFSNLKYFKTEHSKISEFDLNLFTLLEAVDINEVSVNLLGLDTLESLTTLKLFCECDNSAIHFGEHSAIEYFTYNMRLPEEYDIDFSQIPKLKEFHSDLWVGGALDFSENHELKVIDVSIYQEPPEGIILPEQSSLERLVTLGMPILNLSSSERLEYLNLSGGNLKSLTLPNAPNLKFVSVTGTRLSNINFSLTPNIEILNLQRNNINQLDVANLESLLELNLFDNFLSGIDLSANQQLQSLNIAKNPKLSCEAKEYLLSLNLAEIQIDSDEDLVCGFYSQFVDQNMAACVAEIGKPMEDIQSLSCKYMDSTEDLKLLPNLEKIDLTCDFGVKSIDFSPQLNLSEVRLSQCGLDSALDFSSNIHLSTFYAYDLTTPQLEFSNNQNLNSLHLEWSFVSNLTLPEPSSLKTLEINPDHELGALDLSYSSVLESIDVRLIKGNVYIAADQSLPANSEFYDTPVLVKQ